MSPQKSSMRMMPNTGISRKRGRRANASMAESMPPVEWSLLRVSVTSPTMWRLTESTVSSSRAVTVSSDSSAPSANLRLHTKLTVMS